MARHIRNNAGRIVGKVTNSGVFSIRVIGSQLLRKTPGSWTIDLVQLEYAKHAGARVVEIIDMETDLVYRIPIRNLRKKNLAITYFGYKPQAVVPLSQWDVTKQRKG